VHSNAILRTQQNGVSYKPFSVAKECDRNREETLLMAIAAQAIRSYLWHCVHCFLYLFLIPPKLYLLKYYIAPITVNYLVVSMNQHHNF